MKKYLIGVQPTGKIHIGNYLGCIKKGLALQKAGNDVTFLIANYHSLTTTDPSEVETLSSNLERDLTRLGCEKILRQTPEYTKLFFELCCKTNMGPLLKMPQFKDKSASGASGLGILLYPVLMTADIIINDPDVVIVGKDQIPHLDLCNDLSKRHNGKRYDYELGDVEKVMSLRDPSKKMSKSLGESHVLYLFEEDYLGKIKKAVCDEEGLVNLLQIAKGIGIEGTFERNIELKEEIARKMSELFQGNKVYEEG